MARRRRIGIKGITQHVIQRGNNRKNCFVSSKDFIAYVGWLKMYSVKFSVDIHAWALMTNHVHLLCTASQNNHGVSQLMQSLGRMYVRYFNHKYERTGTLWEGRFKSSMVDDAEYLFTLYKYIELNPVRANIVKHPWDYQWSSYHINALGKESLLCKPHDLYLQLGATKLERLRAYQALFIEEITESDIDAINMCVDRELVFGGEKFQIEIESLLG